MCISVKINIKLKVINIQLKPQCNKPKIYIIKNKYKFRKSVPHF